MFKQSIALFRARNDSTLAKAVAADIIVDGAIGRFGWPITLAKFWMCVALLASILLAALLLWLGLAGHWAFWFPSVIPLGLSYLILRLWRGINLGLDRVSSLAKSQLKNLKT
ncbi:hypothetical protein GCM10011309_09110 [Litorimonas cladophorae]|uniref:Uncharacterized protein n=1 Tax=Litorimonas cladophorae TaxID=1220491 RepID=A0A918KHQ0_9PROT|nr:hypothetical protein GCM10011309_09110 [Litorimonas cladophorae]